MKRGESIIAGDKYITVESYSLLINENGVQWRTVGSFFSRAAALKVQKLIETVGVTSPYTPVFEIKKDDTILRPERIRDLAIQGIKPKIVDAV